MFGGIAPENVLLILVSLYALCMLYYVIRLWQSSVDFWSLVCLFFHAPKQSCLVSLTQQRLP